jgi:cytochrome bd-type quinol oxidase subunit 1
LLGFMGLYALLSIAFILIMTKEIAKGVSREAPPHLEALQAPPPAMAAE